LANASYDVLIVGGGQAARRAAEGARAAGPDLSIAIIGEETHAPYDRPPLSKAVLESGGEDFTGCEVRGAETYAEDRIALKLGQRVARLDRSARRVVTEDDDSIGYGRLILATGSRPRTLSVPESLKRRVLTLRTRDDALRIASMLAPGLRVVIVGAGFIGLEVASSMIARGLKPVVLEAADRALGRALPAEVADRMIALHRAAGVDVRLGASVEGFSAAPDGGVLISTATGPILADLVIAGIGVTPNVELAVEAGLRVDDGIIVDAFGATDDPRVFAAGEVTRHPVAGATWAARLESWQVAELQAETVGRSAAGQATAHTAAPWFWSDQLGHNLQVLGHAPASTGLIRREMVDGGVVWFAVDEHNRLVGVLSLDAGREIAVARRLMAKDVRLAPEVLADPAQSLRKLLTE
jgi:anthranilate 1,2-dioxygenase ferredoxin reductase subunit